jgi:hypothetical protein
MILYYPFNLNLSYWGEKNGWFRLERGKDTLKIESTICAWAVPDMESVRKNLGIN